MTDEEIIKKIQESRDRIHFWTPENGATAQSLIEAEKWNLPGEAEIAKAFDFYRGFQWDEKILEQRVSHNRPALVINHMPLIVAAFIAISPPIWDEDFRKFVAIVVRHNRDAQCLLNYLASAQAESASQLQPA